MYGFHKSPSLCWESVCTYWPYVLYSSLYLMIVPFGLNSACTEPLINDPRGCYLFIGANMVFVLYVLYMDSIYCLPRPLWDYIFSHNCMLRFLYSHEYVRTSKAFMDISLPSFPYNFLTSLLFVWTVIPYPPQPQSWTIACNWFCQILLGEGLFMVEEHKVRCDTDFVASGPLSNYHQTCQTMTADWEWGIDRASSNGYNASQVHQ